MSYRKTTLTDMSRILDYLVFFECLWIISNQCLDKSILMALPKVPWTKPVKTNVTEGTLLLTSRSTRRLMMGFWQPVTNLRDYVSQNPPVVTFFLCLLTLAVSFMCLSSYSYTHQLPNPDTTKVGTFNQAGGVIMCYHVVFPICY